MAIRYKEAPDLHVRAEEIAQLIMPHVKIDSVGCVRSQGSSSRNTIARCHALGKVMQMGLNRKAFYALEFLSERFDKMSEAEQTKVIIHELMHIPFSFGGGFKHHDVVNNRSVEMMYDKFVRLKSGNKFW